jgi:hypothetical protein
MPAVGAAFALFLSQMGLVEVNQPNLPSLEPNGYSTCLAVANRWTEERHQVSKVLQQGYMLWHIYHVANFLSYGVQFASNSLFWGCPKLSFMDVLLMSRYRTLKGPYLVYFAEEYSFPSIKPFAQLGGFNEQDQRK